MVSVFASERRRLRREDGGVEFLIVFQDRLCMLQLLLSYPGVFFSQVSFLSDQEHVCQQGTAVV